MSSPHIWKPWIGFTYYRHIGLFLFVCLFVCLSLLVCFALFCFVFVLFLMRNDNVIFNTRIQFLNISGNHTPSFSGCPRAVAEQLSVDWLFSFRFVLFCFVLFCFLFVCLFLRP